MTVPIRPVNIDDCDALGLIMVSASLGKFIGNIPEEHLDLGWRPEDSASGWREMLSEQLPPKEIFSVAEVDDRVVGFVWAGTSTRHPDYQGEIRALYVLPTKQGQGIGRQLVSHAVARLRTDGAAAVLIGCIKENPSCGFYAHLGGIEVLRRPNNVDRYNTEEIFFGWSDLELLM